MTGIFSKPLSGIGIPFAEFPSAARAGVGALQWESQLRILLRSDGVIWRPAGGRQVLRCMATEWTMVTPSSAPQVADSFIIPAGMLAAGLSLQFAFSADKLGGTADTLTIRLKIGGQFFSTPTIPTTAVSGGTNQIFVARNSATSLRRLGASSIGSWGPMSGAAALRPAALTVPNLDNNQTTVELSGQMLTGTTEYGVISYFTAELVG